jgi:hypothetical protein
VQFHQRIIIAVGILGNLLYLALHLALPLHFFGIITRVEEVSIAVHLIIGITFLSLLMAILALLWYLLLPKEGCKYRSFIMVIYLIPFVLELCSWSYGFILAYWQ